MKQTKTDSFQLKIGGGRTIIAGIGWLAAIVLLSGTFTEVQALDPATFTNPDFYFDFSTIKSSGTADYVVDQVTKNPNAAFTFETARSTACVGSGLLPPQVGPDGVNFNKEKQAIRLQYADNINLGSRFMMAMWVKAFYGVPSPRNETLLTQSRYDNRNETPHQFSWGVMSNPSAPAKLGMRFSMFLFNPATGYYQYQESYYQNRLDIQDGWVLLLVSVDNLSDLTQTVVTFKMRNSLTAQKETTTFIYPGLQWLQRQQDKQDIYLGAFCDLFQTASPKVYGNPFRGTISRLYIWRAITDVGIMSDTFLDKYFFRATGNPTCVEGNIVDVTNPAILPCKFCIINGNPSTIVNDPTTTVSCLSEDKTYNQLFIAFWNFDEKWEEPTKQTIEDRSGNGYIMYKGTPADAEPNEPFKLPAQGYLFEVNMFSSAALPILLHNYPQFTIDVWVRRESIPNAFNSAGTKAFSFLMDKMVSSIQYIDFGFEVSDTNNRIIVTMNNIQQQSPAYTNILKDNTWQYFAVSIYRYSVGATKGCRLRYMANVEGLASTANCANGYNDFTITTADTMRLLSSRSYIFKQVRIFQHAMSIDEIPSMVKTTCVKKMGQNQCPICGEDAKCATQCNQNQYENPTDETCTTCHPFCGGCYVPDQAPLNLKGVDTCSFCTRVTSLPVIYSSSQGNCTCKSGLYYDSPTMSCLPCHARCAECYGPSYMQCLTCATGKIFYPPTNCIDNCQDPLVVGDGKYGYFNAMESIGGASAQFAMCIKCHPYCTVCTGTLVTQCQQCQNGFFLQGTQCIDNCPDNKFPDMINKQCSSCAPECLKCTSPVNTTCTKCNPQMLGGVSTTMKLQGGTCKFQCDAGYYSDTDNVCQPCHLACGTCTSPRNTTCGSCTTGYYLEWLGFACKFDCDDGKYGDTMTNMCLLCHYSCLTCKGAGPDQCKVCAKGFLRRKSLCVSKCEEGEFIVDGACFSCDKKCLTCFGPEDDKCYTCADNTVTGLGYYYYGNRCTESCPDGFYPDNFEKVCKPCKTVCSACTSWDFCTACIEGPYQLNNGECTFFQCMTSQYRAVKPTLACYDCDSTCLTCKGMSRFDCETCKPAYKFYENTCLTCKDQPGLTDHPDPLYPGCIEICGDGFNFGMVQCDDGNLVNGDGCNSKCFIEEGWACSGGSRFMPDTCKDMKAPTPKISLINKANQIYISFDEEVVLSDDLHKDPPKIKIAISGNQPFYKFDFDVPSYINAGDHLQSIIIDLNFQMSLRGTEKVSVKFINSGIFQDLAGNGINQVPLIGFLSSFKYLDPFWSKFLDGIADYLLLIMGGLAVGNIICAQVWGVSTTSLWTSLAYLQMIMLAPLLTVNWPNFVTTFFGRLGKVLNGETDAIPNILFTMGIAPAGSKTIIESAINQRFKEYNYEYSNFIYLSGRKMILWVALFAVYPIVWYLKRNYADKHKFCKLWEKLELRYRYTFLLRGLLLSFVSALMASTVNIYKMQFTNLATTICCFISIAAQIGMIYLPILFMNILQRSYDRLDNPKFIAQYHAIIDELDLSHPSKYMYYAVFLMRRVVYVFLIVLFSENVLISVAAHGASSVLMILYILIARPFKRKVTAVLTIFGELFVAGFHAIGMGIRDPDQPDSQNEQFGFVIVGMLALYMVMALMSIIVQVIGDLITAGKAAKAENAEKVEKEREEFDYKKWKKRRQLVKREHVSKERSKLLDQHEELVGQYQKQLEEEEEKRQREEDEKERLENGEEAQGLDQYGNPYQNPYGNQYGGDVSSYMYGGAVYDNSQLMQQQMMGGQNKPQMNSPQYDPRFENGPDSGMRLQESMRKPSPKPKKGKKSSKAKNEESLQEDSRNPLPDTVQLNKNSGGSDEALNRPDPEEEEQQNAPQQQEAEVEEVAAAEVDELYGYEYGGEDYGAEQQPPEAQQPEVEAVQQPEVESAQPEANEEVPEVKEPSSEPLQDAIDDEKQEEVANNEVEKENEDKPLGGPNNEDAWN